MPPWQKFYQEKLVKIFMRKKSLLDLNEGLAVVSAASGRPQPRAKWLNTYFEKIDYRAGKNSLAGFGALSQDAIVCLDPALESAEFFQQTRKVLKPGGYFLGRLPTASDLKKLFEDFTSYESVPEGDRPTVLVFAIK
jgi:hypothetical protein